MNGWYYHTLTRIIVIMAIYSCCTVSTLYPYIYEITKWQKFDAKKKRNQYIIAFGDFHDKMHSANKDQLNQLIKLFKKADKKDIAVIVEDITSQNASGAFGCGNYVINSRGGVLGGLAQTCSKMGIPVSNIEYRYCRVTSFGPVLNNLNLPLASLPSTQKTKISAILREVDAVMNEITEYKHSSSLKSRRDSVIKDVKNHINKLKLHDHKENTVADYLEATSDQKTRLDHLKYLLTFDSCLLDIKLAQTISQLQNKQYIIIVAGGSHISRSHDLLAQLGYNKTGTTDITFDKEYNLRNCIGSPIEQNKFCVKPVPVPLDI